MKYGKLLCLIFVILFLTGCNSNNKDTNTIYYNLDISTYFRENITFYLSRDAYELAEENIEEEQSYANLEYKLLYDNIEPIYSVHDEFYHKDINKNFDNTKVSLNYNYIEDDFIYSNYIMNCFEDYDIINTTGSIEINLRGKFYCLNDKDNVNIRVDSIFPAEKSNGMLEGENTYVWNINKENVNDVNIIHVISRNYEGMIMDSDNIPNNLSTDDNGIIDWDIVKCGILIIILVLLFIFKKRLQIDY